MWPNKENKRNNIIVMDIIMKPKKIFLRHWKLVS